MFNFGGAKKKLQQELEQQSANKTAFQEFNRLKSHEKRFTPDFHQLSRRANHRVFLYNGLMKHIHGQAELDELGSFKATAFTKLRFEVWKKNMDILSFPVAMFKVSQFVPALKLKGELWEISTDGILDLDFSMENGVVFKRIRAEVEIPHREIVFLKNPIEIDKGPAKEPERLSRITSNIQKTMTVPVWLYVGVPEYFEPMLDGGYMMSPINRYGADNYNEEKQYYFFSNNEYKD